MPFASKEPLETWVHCARGNVTSALCNNTKVAFAGPLVAVMVSIVPLTATLVMVGAETIVEVMSRT